MFSYDDKHIISGSMNGDVSMWSGNGELVTHLRSHEQEISHLDISKDDQWILSASKDGLISIQDFQGKEKLSFKKHTSKLEIATFITVRDEIHCFSCDDRNRCIRWDLDGNIIAEFSGFGGSNSTYMSLSPDQKFILTGNSLSGQIVLWDLWGNQLASIDTDAYFLLKIGFTPDQKHLYTISESELRFFPITASEILQKVNHENWKGEVWALDDLTKSKFGVN